MVQGVESAAVPPGGGTSTPTGLDLALKYCAGNPMVMVPPTGRLTFDVNEKITGEVVAFNMNKSFATIAILGYEICAVTDTSHAAIQSKPIIPRACSDMKSPNFVDFKTPPKSEVDGH
jgi:hypothetical protein